jgi:adenosylcobinamide-phosphate synthase
VLADQVWGEPDVTPHPVSAFGSMMHRVEGQLYADRRLAGLVHTGVGLTIGVAAGVAVPSTATATYLSVAGAMLGSAALDIAAALEDGDLGLARGRLPGLVGRDPSDLAEDEIVRAVVESVAENTVDAIVAPVLWAVLAGAPGTVGYRAVNTMDATVGYKSERYLRYGWASARLDDVANYLPARLTALLVASVRPPSARAIWRAVRDDAPGHPSPNSGVAEAAFAAALGVRLGGTNTYGTRVEHRPSLGQGQGPEVRHIRSAVELSRDVTYALVALLAALGWAVAE